MKKRKKDALKNFIFFLLSFYLLDFLLFLQSKPSHIVQFLSLSLQESEQKMHLFADYVSEMHSISAQMHFLKCQKISKAIFHAFNSSKK